MYACENKHSEEKTSIMEHRIAAVDTGSIAEELGVEPGDVLASINGMDIIDVVDYEDACSAEQLTLLFKKADGTELEADVEKDEDEPLGLTFENGLMSPLRRCANHCVFCFVDQLPKGMRDTLYIKDDDWRLSLIMGNFVTLTNVGDGELERIIDRRVSPLYISVHTTDPALRREMMRCEKAGKIMDQLRRLTKSGIRLHCQLVLCPRINDGAALDHTLSDLYSLGDRVLSVAAVPVGLTGHREGLPALTPYDRAGANAVIDCIEVWQKRSMAERGTHFVNASDEFYTIAGRDVPPAEVYEGYPQIENGVGMLRKFQDELNEALPAVPAGCLKGVSATIVTGTSAAAWSERMARLAADRTGLSVRVVSVKNRFFGESVTVTGLLVSEDVAKALSDKELGDAVLIPRSMLRAGEETLLDGGTVDGISEMLNVPVLPFYVDGEDFMETLLSIKKTAAAPFKGAD